MCSIKKENRNIMSAPSAESFLKNNGERIISDVASVMTVNAIAGRSALSKESFKDGILFVFSEFLYSNFVKAFIQPFLVSGMGTFQELINIFIEIGVNVVQIYSAKRYVLGEPVNLMRLFLETLTASLLSDRMAMAIKF
jgi:hypothetical protein